MNLLATATSLAKHGYQMLVNEVHEWFEDNLSESQRPSICQRLVQLLQVLVIEILIGVKWRVDAKECPNFALLEVLNEEVQPLHLLVLPVTPTAPISVVTFIHLLHHKRDLRVQEYSKR